MFELENSEFRGKKSELLFELFGKMWVHLRRFEVNRISVWLGSKGLMRARPGRNRYFLMAWWSKLKIIKCFKTCLTCKISNTSNTSNTSETSKVGVREVREVREVKQVRQVRQVLLDGLVVETKSNIKTC
jgi:hypothetical protein